MRDYEFWIASAVAEPHFLNERSIAAAILERRQKAGQLLLTCIESTELFAVLRWMNVIDSH